MNRTTIAMLAALALAGSGVPIRAQNLGGESVKRVATSSMVVAVKGGVAWRGAKANHDFGRRHDFPGLLSGFGAPYWGDYSWPIGTGHGYTHDYNYGYGQDHSAPGHERRYESRWDDNNHSLALERRWHVTGQPSAPVTAVPSQDNDERDRAWVKRCEPRLAFDDNGVQRYSYNGKHGCSSGQWDE